MRLSLGNRLIVALVAGGSVTLGGLFLVLDLAIDRELYTRFDAALTARGRVLAGLIDTRARATVSDAARWPEYAADGHQEFYQLWAADGATLARSASSDGHDLARPPRRPGEQALLYDLVLPDGHRGRAVAMAVHGEHRGSGKQGPQTLVVATEREALEALERRLHLALSLGTLAALALMALLGIVTVRRGLAPLARFSDAIAARVVTRTHAGPAAVPTEPAGLPAAGSLPAELQPIATRLNEAVDTALAALAREQRFAREAAHELRTPLAELRILVASEAGGIADPVALRRAVDGMTRSVDALLALARCEAGLETPAIEPVDLAEMLARQVGLLASEAAARGLDLALEAPAELWVMSDHAMLERIVANLIGNAVYHAPDGERVEVRAGRAGDSVRFTVANAAPGLDVDTLAQVLAQPRPVNATAETRPHAGLGLRLSEALARQLGLDLKLAREDERLVVCLGALTPLDGLT